MNCREVKEIIQLYMDDELDARDTLMAQQHIEICSGCSHILDELLDQDQMLKEAAFSEVSDSRAIRESILAAIRGQSAAAKSSFFTAFWWRRVAAIAGIILLATLLVLRSDLMPGVSGSVYAAVASDHAAHCSFGAAMGAITDGAELNRLAVTYGKMKSSPDLSSFGYANPRGTICRVNGVEFFHLVFYDQQQQPLSVFVRPHSLRLIKEQLVVLEEGDYQLASVSRSGVDLIVVAQASDARIADITQSIASQM